MSSEVSDYKWVFQPLTEEERLLSEQLSEKERLLPTISQILVRRGIREPDALQCFLKPDLSHLHDPFLMEDMHSAVERLNEAIGNKERILIYGDYDVDGITSVALVYKYLRLISTNINYYIPDRNEEGSGISKQSIDFAAEHNFTLIITLDCGIKELEMVEYAQTLGIDFIICDHHVPGDELPKAVACLNPKISGSAYPYKNLSGCGVGFKFMQAFSMSNDSDPRQLHNLLDLVAVSIAADLVPLTGENRVLATFGLRKLNKNPSIGLKSIIDISGLRDKVIDISDIIFKIGPRINASGRMQSGRESVDLLLAKDATDAKVMSHHLDEYNNQRREIDHSITQEANEIVEGFMDMEDRKIIIVYDPSWHNGVIGIVASRLSEKYNRPAIVLTDTNNNMVSGSARSVQNYDIHTLLEQTSHLLENFGGHPFAAGVTLRKKHLHEFILKATSIAEEQLTIEELTPKYLVEAELSLSEILTMFKRQLRWLEPYGNFNEKPIFCSRKIVCITPPRLIGFKKSHVRLMLSHPDEMPIVQAVAYNQADTLPPLLDGKPLDILYTIDEFSKMGKRSVQLNIVSIRPHQP